MTRASINPALLVWARNRARVDAAVLEHRFPRLGEWEAGTRKPTVKQLDAFAQAVHVPVGFLFLDQPPDEPAPIPDFRTVTGAHLTAFSPNLLDMIYACQERQSWYRDFSLTMQQVPLSFVGSANIQDSVASTAEMISEKIKFSIQRRVDCSNWEEALRYFVKSIENSGVLVMISGIVLSNTSRILDVSEFRGFALADDIAPLIFVNGADSKSAQMFTLAHELAHIWLGSSAVSNASSQPQNRGRAEEVWCNAVAAEILVPLDILRLDLHANEPLSETVNRLARRYKVSTLVILRRLLDVGWLSRPNFDRAWETEQNRLQALVERRSSGGGNFYRATLSRVSRRFARAVVESTVEGQTLYRDAFRMLGVAKSETFQNIGREVGVL